MDLRGLPIMHIGRHGVPDVEECLGHGDQVVSCSQCNGGHAHVWAVVWVAAEGSAGVRCSVCGGRCCSQLSDWAKDRNPCTSRRHHGDPHHYRDGTHEPVGGAWLRGTT